jgi:SWI/SNF-related matrix-associated actin-dependent regulator 1 of chromatin subfamily A
MTLSFHEKSKTFLLFCLYEERRQARTLGFEWDHDLRLWKTKDKLNALKAYEYADKETKVVLDQFKEELNKKLLESYTPHSNIVIPKPDNGMDYFPFQKAGIEFCSKHTHSFLFDDTGVGKSIQGIGLINHLKAKKVLIICPNSLKINWKRELDKWLYDKSLTYDVSTSNEVKTTDIMICNYEIFRMSISKQKGIKDLKYNCTQSFFNAIKKMKFDLILLDEAHRIKNWSANTTKNIFKLRKQTTRSVLMTGTPVLNRPEELWIPLRWAEIHKDFAPNKEQFLIKYCGAEYVPRFNSYVTNSSKIPKDVLTELQTKLRSSVMIRRTKEQVFPEMPKKIRQIVEVEVEKALFLQFKDLERDIYSIDVNSDKGFMSYIKPTELALLAELRRVSGEAKFDAVVDYVSDLIENDEKVILFCHHVELINRYEKVFKKYGAVKISGSVNNTDRDNAVQSFQNNPKCKILIGQMDSAGVGLTLTASSNVVFAELHYVPAIASQCEDRALRYGQKKTVNVHILCGNDTLDAYIAKMIVKKQQIIDQIVEIERLDV